MGFHFCNNHNLVFQISNNVEARNLYQKLQSFKIDQKVREQYLKFICNYYTIDLSSKQLYSRLVNTSHDYFKMIF